MILNFQNFTSHVLKKTENLTSVSYKTVSYKNRMRVLRELFSFKITFTDDENTGDSMAVFPASGPGSNAPLTNNATPNSETGSMNIASNRSTPSKKPALNLGALGALGYGDIHDDNDDKDVEVKLVS